MSLKKYDVVLVSKRVLALTLSQRGALTHTVLCIHIISLRSSSSCRWSRSLARRHGNAWKACIPSNTYEHLRLGFDPVVLIRSDTLYNLSQTQILPRARRTEWNGRIFLRSSLLTVDFRWLAAVRSGCWSDVLAQACRYLRWSVFEEVWCYSDDQVPESKRNIIIGSAITACSACRLAVLRSISSICWSRSIGDTVTLGKQHL